MLDKAPQGSGLKFNDNRYLKRTFNPMLWDDMQSSVSTAKVPANQSPTWRSYDYGIAGGDTYPALGFGSNDYIDFFVQTPHTAQINAILDYHLHWTIPTDSEGDRFAFKLNIIAAGINNKFRKLEGSPFRKEYVLKGNESGRHNYLDVAHIDDKANPTVSSLLICTLSRTAASVDEYGGEIYISYDDFHILHDTAGSILEGYKE
ncbi:MAG: hypothetical protein DRP42_07755 [Tenericutes bacterium]|nr:MAG: hypothetical protein DRP42_07755 [Mycoplasmatota bacterium]